MPDAPAPGIRWYRTKWRVSVSVGGRGARRTTSTLCAADTPVREMRAWQEAARTQLRAEAEAAAEAEADATPPAPTPGAPLTLAAAAEAYLATVTAMPSYVSRAADLRAWTQALGDVPLPDLTAHDLLATVNGWRRDGLAVSTLNHRRTALLACLALHEADAEALARGTLAYADEPLPVPRELPYPLVRQVLAAMPPSRAQAVLAVMAETGLPPATVRRLQPDDVDERHRQVTLPVRQKGGKVAGVTLPLTPAAVEAFAAVRTRRAWGGVTRQTLCLVWGRACAAVRAGAYPETVPHRARGTLTGPATRVPVCTPYILRHSFAGRVLDATGGDIQALQQLLQHRDLETTMRYVRSRASRAAVAAIAKLA